MRIALIGPVQSGKSTILSAICGKAASAAGAVSVNEEVVAVPDERLDWLTGLYQPKKTVHGTIDSLDLPGLSFTDENGRAAARRLFGQVRTVDMFVFVVRAFDDASVAAYRNRIDPAGDTEARTLMRELSKSALQKLDPVWEELFPAERERIGAVRAHVENEIRQWNADVRGQLGITSDKDLGDVVAAILSERPLSNVLEKSREGFLISALYALPRDQRAMRAALL